MVTPEIIEIVKSEILDHKSWDEIRLELRFNNWSNSDIQTIYATIHNGEQLNNDAPVATTPRKTPSKSIYKPLILVFILIFILGEVYFIQSKNKAFVTDTKDFFIAKYPSQLSFLVPTATPTIKPTPAPLYSRFNPAVLQQINNVGYSFYLGQVDYPNSPGISDTTKNDVTNIMYKAKFPKKLLSNVVIVFINTLALKPSNMMNPDTMDFIQLPNKTSIPVPIFSPDFLTGGGIYTQSTFGMSMIYINNKKLGDLEDILTHELGHHIGSQLTDVEWAQFYKLRYIPSNTERHGGDWRLIPFEDFAEVYKNIYTGLPIDTVYGLLTKNEYKEYACGQIHDNLIAAYEKIHGSPKSIVFTISTGTTNSEAETSIQSDTQLLSCRRNVLAYPDKYIQDYQQSSYQGAPYISEVDQQTKDFVQSIIVRLN